MSWNECSKGFLPLKWADVSRPLHDESEMISNVVADPGDENVASREPPPLLLPLPFRLCNDGDLGITRVMVVEPKEAIGCCKPATRKVKSPKLVGIDAVVVRLIGVLTFDMAGVVVAVPEDDFPAMWPFKLLCFFTYDFVRYSPLEDEDDEDDDDDEEEEEDDEEHDEDADDGL